MHLMKKISYWLLLTLLIVQPALSGTKGKIAGRITDAQNGQPLAGANVIVEGTVMGSATDLNGYYAILNVDTLEEHLKRSANLFKKGR